MRRNDKYSERLYLKIEEHKMQKTTKTVGDFTECEQINSLNFQTFSMETSLKKTQQTSGQIFTDRVANIEARFTETVEPKTNTIISIPSRFTEEVYPPVYPAKIIMSVILRDCKKVKKQDCLPELFSFKLVEANYKAEPQLEAIRDILV